MFILRVGHDYSNIKSVLNLKARIGSRTRISVPEYDEIMERREKAFGLLSTTPEVIFLGVLHFLIFYFVGQLRSIG